MTTHMKALRALAVATGSVARAVEALAGSILAAQVLLLTFSAVQGILNLRSQVLWLTEAAEHGLIQLAMLGAALALRAKAHQGIDTLTRLFPRRLQAACEAGNWLLIAAFGAVFAVLGTAYVHATWAARSRFASADVPTWPFYLCYPVSGVLFAAFSVENLLASWFARRPPAGRGGGGKQP